jgi:preprotein translocase subunit YajC
MPGYVVFAQDKDAKPVAEPKATTGEGDKPTGKTAPPGGLGGVEMPLILGAIFFMFYFVVLRPGQKRQERERQNLLSGLNKNDKVLTTGGIYGTVVTVSDKEDEVTVKVDDNTRLKMLKGSIARNITREEALKAEKEQKEKTK